MVVVGNVVVGGSGKTPLVIALARALHGRGLKVGLLARGYRASSDTPLLIDRNTPGARPHWIFWSRTTPNWTW